MFENFYIAQAVEKARRLDREFELMRRLGFPVEELAIVEVPGVDLEIMTREQTDGRED